MTGRWLEASVGRTAKQSESPCERPARQPDRAQPPGCQRGPAGVPLQPIVSAVQWFSAPDRSRHWCSPPAARLTGSGLVVPTSARRGCSCMRRLALVRGGGAGACPCPLAARPSAVSPGLDATSLPVPDRCQRGVLIKDPNQGAELILVKTSGLEFAEAQAVRVVVVDASVDLLWRECLEQIGRGPDTQLPQRDPCLGSGTVVGAERPVDEWIVGVRVARCGWRLIAGSLAVVGRHRGRLVLAVALGWLLVGGSHAIVVNGWLLGRSDEPSFMVSALGPVQV